jgi:polar amino acid transport system permease protein
MRIAQSKVKGLRARVKILDVVVLAFIAAVGLYLAYRVKVGLHYQWNWEAIPSYFLRFDPDRGRWVPNLLLQGLFTTLRLSVWGTFIALLVGTFVGFGRLSRSRFRRMLARFYVELIRNLPPLVLVFIFYYFIGDQIMAMFGLEALIENQSARVQGCLALLLAPPELFTPFISALIALGFFEGAYIAEIVRAGIQSIEKGQWEASNALGLSRWQRMRHVILPQALPRMVPSMVGQFISTIKDSAIVSVISIQELTFQGLELMATTYLTFEVWITITGVYLLMALSLSLVLRVRAKINSQSWPPDLNQIWLRRLSKTTGIVALFRGFCD